MRLAVLGLVLLAAGAAAVVVGILPASAAAQLAGRVAPVLGFVVAVSAVAELASEAGLFERLAHAAVILARGRAWSLWLLVVVIAVASTTFLSLDTTAVLLTPVVVMAAQRASLPPLPFAMTTVWLANTGSLLLPVSNLTNLLAQQRIGDTARFVALTAAPAAVAVAVPVALLGLRYRAAFARRFEAVAPPPAADRPLLVAAALVTALLVPALVSGIEVWIPATAAALVLVAAFAVRRPDALRFGLLPLPLVVFAAGLFLVVAAADRLGLQAVLAGIAGSGEDTGGLLRLAGVGATAANAADNLPAYLALEPVADSPRRLVALLVGVNAGPLITPWASLATLLWGQRLAALGVRVRWSRFAAGGVVAAVATVTLATLCTAFTA